MSRIIGHSKPAAYAASATGTVITKVVVKDGRPHNVHFYVKTDSDVKKDRIKSYEILVP